jgi:predicted acyl esterase
MYGTCYSGFNSIQMAIERPPHDAVLTLLEEHHRLG